MSAASVQAQPPPHGERECDWCGEPNTHTVPVKPKQKQGIGQFVYACGRHKHLAYAAAGREEPGS